MLLYYVIVLCCFILLFVISLRGNFKVSYLETVQLQGYGCLLLGSGEVPGSKNRQVKRTIGSTLLAAYQSCFKDPKTQIRRNGRNIF